MSTLALANYNPEIDKLVAKTHWRAYSRAALDSPYRYSAEGHDEFGIVGRAGQVQGRAYGYTVTSCHLEPQGPFETLDDAKRVLCLLASFKVEQREDLGIGLTYEVVSAEFGRSAPCATLAEAQAALKVLMRLSGIILT